MSKYSPEFLTQKSYGGMSIDFIKRAIDEKTILEAQVTRCNADCTLVLDLGKNIVGEITFSEIEYHYDDKETKVAAATTKVGRHVKFIPVSVELNNYTGEYKVHCSRKDAQKDCFDNFIKKLIPGDIIDAKVLKIVSYGIFCDIGCGYTAILPTNNISVTHIINPCESLKFIHRLRVVVKEIDENYMIQLSHKELLGTWKEEVSQFREDDIVVGEVLSKEDYGVFIRLSQNLSGLAEITNLDIESGDSVVVRISSIKAANMKIKLLILNKVESEDDRIKGMHFKYRDINKDHIDSWTYSTRNSRKVIETKFNCESK
jgi:small subunit ribosomal protein S1